MMCCGFATIHKHRTKMSQHRNSSQSKIFIDFMEQHPQLARPPGYNDPVKNAELWSDLALQLNGFGPPEKDVEGWKNSWREWQKNIKRKLSFNKEECRATGEGPFKHILSAAEESVARLTKIHAVVKGITNASDIGCEFENKIDSVLGKPPVIAASTPTQKTKGFQVLDNDNDDVLNEPEIIASSSGASFSKTQTCSISNSRHRTKPAFVSQNVGTLIEEENRHLLNITDELKELKISMDNFIFLFGQHLEEAKRHNLAIEKLLDDLKQSFDQ